MKFKIKPNDFVSFYVNSSKLIIEKDSADKLSAPVESRVIAVATDVYGNASDMFLEPINAVDPSDYFWNTCESAHLKQRSKTVTNGKILLSDDIDKYEGVRVLRVQHYHIVSVRTKIDSVTDFCKCDSCENIVHMAAPNQPDGKTFICYSCRQNPIRKYY